MFKKPFKVKSNTSIRGSERRKLRNSVSKCFTVLQADLSQIIPNKEEMSIMKIVTHNDKNVTCYCLKKNPILFEVDGILFPTVYLLWNRVCNILSFQTYPNVFTIITAGADLMFPGVFPPVDGGYLDFHSNAICYITLIGNSAAVAVGLTQCSKQDLLTDGPQGKRVNIYHCYKDYLWSAGEKSELPLVHNDHIKVHCTDSVLFSPLNVLENMTETKCNEADEIKNSEATTKTAKNVGIDNINECSNGYSTSRLEEIVQLSPQEEMDALLMNCFCQAILDAKTVDLPILVSKFSSHYLHSACPDGKRIDVRKSSYKKMSKFLSEMQSIGIIEVKDLSKGVESITSICFDNEIIRNYKQTEFAKLKKAMKEIKSNEEKEETRNYQFVEVRELYVVSAKTIPFFEKYNICKGATFSSAEVRKFVTEYVKENQLVDSANKKYVILDPLLTDTLYGKEEHDEKLPWDVLVDRLLSNMNICHEVTLPGQKPVVKKGKMEFIEISIEQRMGNKKVTVVKNLEMFGIDTKLFAQELQLIAASSTTVTAVPGKNSANEFVIVQGVQLKHVQKLLENRKIQKKLIKGLDSNDAKKKS